MEGVQVQIELMLLLGQSWVDTLENEYLIRYMYALEMGDKSDTRYWN